MNITQNSIDDLNAVLTVSINKEDYQDKVGKTLNQYRKTANIKGFRKGQVPMSFVKKQYEKSIIFDEVNQLLQTGINDYIQKEQLSILGNPLPKANESLDWDADQLDFEFELGLAPEISVDLSKVNVDKYKVTVTDAEVQKYVDNFAKRFGSIKSLEKVEEGANIKVEVRELDKEKNLVQDGIQKDTFLFVDELAKPKKFIGKKVGDVVVIKPTELFIDKMNLEQLLEKTEAELMDFDHSLQFTIQEISRQEPSEVDQSLFDKVYGEGAVSNEKEFRQKIKEEAEKMYEKETDKQFMNEVVEQLVKETKFELPNEFLSRWLNFSNEKIESEEQAKEELAKMEDGLRYQLIEAKIAETYNLKVEHQDVLDATKKLIKEQFAMYGQSNIPEEELDTIVQSSLTNQQEYQRVADQVFSDKMLQVFKDNVSVKEIGVTFDEFVEIMTEKAKKHNHSHAEVHDHQH